MNIKKYRIGVCLPSGKRWEEVECTSETKFTVTLKENPHWPFHLKRKKHSTTEDFFDSEKEAFDYLHSWAKFQIEKADKDLEFAKRMTVLTREHLAELTSEFPHFLGA